MTRAPKPRWRTTAFCLVLAVGLAVTWSVVARDHVAASRAREPRTELDRAERAFNRGLEQRQAELRLLCAAVGDHLQEPGGLPTQETVLVERVIAARKLVGDRFVAVLSPEGRVIAQAGEDRLVGLALADARAVVSARTTLVPQSGTWLLGSTITQVSVVALRVEATTLAYVVVGQLITPALLAELATTGVGVATIVGSSSTTSSTEIDRVVAAIAASPNRVDEIRADGQSYLASVRELRDVTNRLPRVVFVRATSQHATFALVDRIAWAVPLMVLVSVLFAALVHRRSLRLP